MRAFALACCSVPDILLIDSLSVLSKTVQRSQPEQRTNIPKTWAHWHVLVIKASRPQAHCDTRLLSLFSLHVSRGPGGLVICRTCGALCHRGGFAGLFCMPLMSGGCCSSGLPRWRWRYALLCLSAFLSIRVRANLLYLLYGLLQMPVAWPSGTR
jgi:hypothetical protein